MLVSWHIENLITQKEDNAFCVQEYGDSNKPQINIKQNQC